MPAQLNQRSGFLQEIVQMPIIRCQPFKDPTPWRLTGIRDVVKINFHCRCLFMVHVVATNGWLNLLCAMTQVDRDSVSTLETL